MEKEPKKIFYQCDRENIKIEVFYHNNTLWMTQDKIEELFGAQKITITKLIKRHIDKKKLKSEYFSVAHPAKDEKEYNTALYNLDAISSIGDHINSNKTTKFKIWATNILEEFEKEGYIFNAEQLKERKHSEKKRYVALLRGINVGGHHKVPMAELRKEFQNLDFENVVTILNSGNILFNAIADNLENLENIISKHLEHVFGFAIPTIIKKSETIIELIKTNPFKEISISKNIQLYVSFLHRDIEPNLKLPWTNDDNTYKILSKTDKTIVSVLDLSSSKTPKGMLSLEKYYGKDITTRNWNTIKRIKNKI